MSTLLELPPSAEEVQKPEFEPGLDVLNAAEGHLNIKFDKDSPEETAKAQKIIGDMLKRGYAIFIDVGDGELKRVKHFKKDIDSYVVEEIPDEKAESVKPIKKYIPRKKAKATGIPPTAGG